MRQGRTGIIYSHTAEECAEMACSSRAFAHVNKKQIVDDLNSNAFASHRVSTLNPEKEYDEKYYCNGKSIPFVIDENGENYEAPHRGEVCYWPDNFRIEHYDPKVFFKWAYLKYGAICLRCKTHHFDNLGDIYKTLGKASVFFEDILIPDNLRWALHWPPLCILCANRCESNLWTAYRRPLISTKNYYPTNEELECAVVQWLANDLIRELKAQKKNKAAA